MLGLLAAAISAYETHHQTRESRSFQDALSRFEQQAAELKQTIGIYGHSSFGPKVQSHGSFGRKQKVPDDKRSFSGQGFDRRKVLDFFENLERQKKNENLKKASVPQHLPAQAYVYTGTGYPQPVATAKPMKISPDEAGSDGKGLPDMYYYFPLEKH